MTIAMADIIPTTSLNERSHSEKPSKFYDNNNEHTVVVWSVVLGYKHTRMTVLESASLSDSVVLQYFRNPSVALYSIQTPSDQKHANIQGIRYCTESRSFWGQTFGCSNLRDFAVPIVQYTISSILVYTVRDDHICAVWLRETVGRWARAIWLTVYWDCRCKLEIATLLEHDWNYCDGIFLSQCVLYLRPSLAI